jgi:hypothetical protein
MADVLKASIRLDKPDEIEKKLLQEMRKQFSQALERIAPQVRLSIQDLVEAGMRASPEWDSLLGGKLRESFGIAEPHQALEDIAHAVRESVQVKQVRAYGDSMGGFNITILKDDFAEVLQTRGATYTYTANEKLAAGKPGGIVTVPWLQWLLFSGDNIVLASVEINLSKPRSASRTGRAIMVHVGTSKFSNRTSRGWSVPPEFSGVADDNWLSRVLAPLEGNIQDVLQRAIKEIS